MYHYYARCCNQIVNSDVDFTDFKECPNCLSHLFSDQFIEINAISSIDTVIVNFPLILQGEGKSIQEAWDNALEGFQEDTGNYEDFIVIEPKGYYVEDDIITEVETQIYTNKYRHQCDPDKPKMIILWEDEWYCVFNDECPNCGTEDIEPYESIDRNDNSINHIPDCHAVYEVILYGFDPKDEDRHDNYIRWIQAFTRQQVFDFCKENNINAEEVIQTDIPLNSLGIDYYLPENYVFDERTRD